MTRYYIDKLLSPDEWRRILGEFEIIKTQYEAEVLALDLAKKTNSTYRIMESQEFEVGRYS